MSIKQKENQLLKKLDENKRQLCKIVGHKLAIFQAWNDEDDKIDSYCQRCKMWKSHW